MLNLKQAVKREFAAVGIALAQQQQESGLLVASFDFVRGMKMCLNSHFRCPCICFYA